MRNKYGNRKVVVEGITFDSIAESEFYNLLCQRVALGEILDFELQPKFELIPKFEKFGRTTRPETYSADFLVHELDGSTTVIDVKGFVTDKFAIKRKQFDYKFKTLLLVLYAECPKKYIEHQNEVYPGFIELDKLTKLRAAEKRRKKVEANGKR